MLKNILILIFKKAKECIELKRVWRDRHPCLNSVRRRLTTAYRSASGQALAWSSTHSALSLRLQSNLVPIPSDTRNVGKPFRYTPCEKIFINMINKEILTIEYYQEDVTVEIASIPEILLQNTDLIDSWISISEILWHRILFLGKAYKLHFPNVIKPLEDSVFNYKQCEYFEEEICFLLSVINDEAVNYTLNILLSEINKIKFNSKYCLIISPP
jgi:hypothetical protein